MLSSLGSTTSRVLSTTARQRLALGTLARAMSSSSKKPTETSRPDGKPLQKAFSVGRAYDFSQVQIDVPYFEDISVWPFPHGISLSEASLATYFKETTPQTWRDKRDQDVDDIYCANAGHIWLGTSEHPKEDGSIRIHRHFLKESRPEFVARELATAYSAVHHGVEKFFFKVSYGRFRDRSRPFTEESAALVRRFGQGHDFEHFKADPSAFETPTPLQQIVDLYHFLFLMGESDLDNPGNVLLLDEQSTFNLNGFMHRVTKIDSELTFPGPQVREEWNRRLIRGGHPPKSPDEPLPFTIPWSQNLSHELGADSFFEKRVTLSDPLLGYLAHATGGDILKVADMAPSQTFLAAAVEGKPIMESLMNTFKLCTTDRIGREETDYHDRLRFIVRPGVKMFNIVTGTPPH
ncbi:MAG: hypothetical protein ACI9BD_000914 [Candidatus Marinamargulisbacteria bacterium]|jgi:hypothetical protein